MGKTYREENPCARDTILYQAQMGNKFWVRLISGATVGQKDNWEEAAFSPLILETAKSEQNPPRSASGSCHNPSRRGKVLPAAAVMVHHVTSPHRAPRTQHGAAHLLPNSTKKGAAGEYTHTHTDTHTATVRTSPEAKQGRAAGSCFLGTVPMYNSSWYPFKQNSYFLLFF